MELLRNRGTAVLLCVLMIVCSALMGARFSLGFLRRQAEEVFYTGADGSGLGAADDINDILAASQDVGNMAAAGYLSADSAQLADMQNRRQAVLDADSPAARYTAAQELRLSALGLCETLETLDLEAMHASWLMGYKAELESAYARLNRSYGAYDQEVARFNSELASFPANLLGGLTGVKKLERAG